MSRSVSQRAHKQFWAALLVSIALLSVLAACGGDPTATPTPPALDDIATPTPPPGDAPPTPTPDADALFQAEWDALVEAAQSEGELVVMAGGGTSARIIGAWIDQFGGQFGIRVVGNTGRSVEHFQRILAERAAGIQSADVWIGSQNITESLIENNIVQPIPPLLFAPDAKDESVWWRGEFLWTDPATQQYALLMQGGGEAGRLAHNTDLVDPAELRSWWDLADPKWKGKIVVIANQFDHECQFVELGEEWHRAILVDQEPLVAGNQRQAADWIARGVVALGTISLSSEIRPLMEGGLPVANQLPHSWEECNSLSSGGGVLFVIQAPKNPNASKLFINWVLTREGQIATQSASGYSSLREDVPTEGLDPTSLRVAGFEYDLTCCDVKYKDAYERAVEATTRIAREHGLWQ